MLMLANNQHNIVKKLTYRETKESHQESRKSYPYKGLEHKYSMFYKEWTCFIGHWSTLTLSCLPNRLKMTALRLSSLREF